MDILWQDLRYGFRMLIKSPGFTLIAVLTIGIGIGANTAIFSVVNSILLRPLPYKDTERLMKVYESNEPLGLGRFAVSLANYVDWKDQNKVFDDVAAYLVTSFTYASESEPARVQGAAVTSSLFNVLGVTPVMGQVFSPEEEKPGGARTVVLSYGLWQRRFASDPNIVGKEVIISGITRTVVAVMPQEFEFPVQPEKIELWVPLISDPRMLALRGSHSFNVVARLKANTSPEQAQAQMTSISTELQKQYPDTNLDWGVRIIPLQEDVVGNTKPALMILLAAVALVLLIACVNISNLLLIRAAGRQKEMAVRTALGVRRARLIRQLLTESLLLGLVGGIVGLLLAMWGVKLLIAFSPSNIPRIQQLAIDGRVLIFTLGISLVTGILFGLVPALQSVKINLNEVLKEGGKGAGGSMMRHRTRSLLLVSEVALSVMLLISAGLLIKSFIRLQQVNPGFDTERLVSLNISLPLIKYRTATQQMAYFQQTLQRLQTTPGVDSVAAGTSLPLTGSNSKYSITIEGQPSLAPGQRPSPNYRIISPDYFRTMGIALIRGREFIQQDETNSSKVIIINDTMAKRFWPGEDPVGKRVTISDLPDNPWREIVGVAADVKHFGLDTVPEPELYVPFMQAPSPSMTIVARANGNPANLISAVRSEILKIDNEIPVYNIRTIKELISESVAWPRFRTILLGIFASISLLLSAVGIYGVMSYSVVQRTREIGIRMALGAQKSNLISLIIGQGMWLTAIGVFIGILGAYASSRLLSSLLFETGIGDFMTYIASIFLLALVALLANYFPARKAAKIDPMIALRYD
jgi:putative ABC transport system permease protein